MNLFLDDIRNPKDPYYYTRDRKYVDLEWVVVRSFDEFTKFIEKNGIPDLISFDHDLTAEQYWVESDPQSWQEYYEASHYDRNMTGYDCAKWLCNYCLDNEIKLPEYKIHSFNHVGSENIRTYLENFKKNSSR